jgi:hypothetical protein
VAGSAVTGKRKNHNVVLVGLAKRIVKRGADRIKRSGFIEQERRPDVVEGVREERVEPGRIARGAGQLRNAGISMLVEANKCGSKRHGKTCEIRIPLIEQFMNIGNVLAMRTYGSSRALRM